MLIGISSRKENDKLNNKLEELLEPYASLKKEVYIGFRTNKDGFVHPKYKISYSNELGIWWYFGTTKNRYWNCFGVTNPEKRNHANIIVEINMPFEGKNFRCSGIWAKDKYKNYYLLHDGGIGGGSKGIGKKIFLDNFEGNYEKVFVVDEEKEFARVTQVNDDNVAQQLSWFVKEIKRIKDFKRAQKKDGKTLKAKKNKEHKFSSEYFGIKKYNLPDEIKSDCNHGLVVKELKNILEKNGIKGFNDRYRDLYTMSSPTKINRLFEVKTALSRQSIYTAIGQLFLNSITNENSSKLIFVCPDDIDKELISDLNNINIKVLTFNWKNKKPVFNNLDILK